MDGLARRPAMAGRLKEGRLEIIDACASWRGALRRRTSEDIPVAGVFFARRGRRGPRFGTILY